MPATVQIVSCLFRTESVLFVKVRIARTSSFLGGVWESFFFSVRWGSHDVRGETKKMGGKTQKNTVFF